MELKLNPKNADIIQKFTGKFAASCSPRGNRGKS
jgi:hypothetical protein